MLQPGTLFSLRLWRYHNWLTLTISVLPNHLDRGVMSFWRLGLSKSQMPFAIIIPIRSNKMHHWAIRLLVWGEKCKVLVARFKVWKLWWTAKDKINLPLGWIAITIRCRRQRLNTIWKRMHVSNNRCKHFCHQHAVLGNQRQRGLRKIQRKSLIRFVLTRWR